jgi:NAD(P)-dependent dehydrogenase (short-subunit alcohol dehydrogenase family)
LNVTSMAGLVASGTSGLSAYGASKHAANAFSSILRTELAGFGIAVTTINPSFHATPLVKDMGEQLTKVWNNLDETKRKEYGQGACATHSSVMTLVCGSI